MLLNSGTLVQAQVNVGSELSALEDNKEAEKAKLTTAEEMPYISTSACGTKSSIRPAFYQGVRRLSLSTAASCYFGL